MGYIKPKIVKAIFAVSGNECTMPNCTNELYDVASKTIIGKIAHIKANSENGPRFDPQQTEEERNGYNNLLLLCGPHHDIIDDKDNIEEYTIETLRPKFRLKNRFLSLKRRLRSY